MNKTTNSWQEKIDDYLLGKLSKKESESFELYCFSHPDFLAEVRRREQLIITVKERGNDLLSDNMKEEQSQKSVILGLENIFYKVQKKWIYVAAAILIIIFYLIPGIFIKDSSEINRANFAAHPYFESLLNQTFMSSGIFVSVQSPQINENFEADIEFFWKIQKDGTPYFKTVDLIIMNNSEHILHTTKVVEGRYILKEELIPGVYYWTIEYQKEMLYLGKFYVKKPADFSPGSE